MKKEDKTVKTVELSLEDLENVSGGRRTRRPGINRPRSGSSNRPR